jgi:hypothetical protein
MGTDFNGDGRDDILWRDVSNGVVSNWLGTPNGGFVVNDELALDPWAHGTLAAIGDFNGDGRDDTLWRSDGTELFVGFTDPGGAFNFYWNLGFVPPEVPISWQVVGAGDFNGDGLDDILWRHDDGRISNWLGNADGSFTINDSNALTNSLAAWPVQGIGDFNGDGRDDIVTRLSNGTFNLSLGTSTGAFAHEDPFAGSVPAEWQVIGVGDFNGDGEDDLLWRNSNSGAISNWLYAGGLGSTTFTINDANAFRVVSSDWHLIAVGDYNGDSRDDILWRNTNTGVLSNWLGTATGGWTINDANALIGVPTNWIVEPNISGGSPWDY